MAIPVPTNLKNLGISEIKFYYKNCPVVGNIFTSCVFMSEDKKLLARGVAICSLSDSHSKKDGREISLKRAKKAFFKKGNSDKINPDFLRSNIMCDYKKFFKIKNEELKVQLIDIITSLGFSWEEKTFDNFKRLDVYIPYAYPIEVASQIFTFKSEYEPKPTNEELTMFRLV